MSKDPTLVQNHHLSSAAQMNMNIQQQRSQLRKQYSALLDKVKTENDDSGISGITVSGNTSENTGGNTSENTSRNTSGNSSVGAGITTSNVATSNVANTNASNTNGDNTNVSNTSTITNVRGHVHSPQQIQAMHVQQRAKLIESLQSWNEMTESPETMLVILQSCNRHKLYTLAISLFRRWNNEKFKKMNITIHMLISLMQLYSRALFHSGDIKSAYVHLKMCTDATNGRVRDQPQVIDSKSTSKSKSKRKLTAPPKSIVLYSGPDEKSIVYILMNQIYNDVLQATSELIKLEDPTTFAQERVLSFNEVFEVNESPIQIFMGSLFPDATSRSDYKEMNPSIWIDQELSNVWLNLRLVAWRVSPTFQYIPHPSLGHQTRNVICRLSLSDFKNLPPVWTVATYEKMNNDNVSINISGESDAKSSIDITTTSGISTSALSTSVSAPDVSTSTVSSPSAPTIAFKQSTICDLVEEIRMNPLKPPYPNAINISGYEDVKFIGPSSTNMWITFHSFEFHDRNLLRMMIAPLDMTTGQLMKPAVLVHGFGESQQKQKNWVAFWFQQQLFFIYSWCPMVILHCQLHSGKVSLVSLDMPSILNEWRGSTPPIEISKSALTKLKIVPHDDCTHYLCLIHDNPWKSSIPHYSHRFIVFYLQTSKNHMWRYPFHAQITHVSSEFRFDKNMPIEFINSIAWLKSSSVSAQDSKESINVVHAHKSLHVVIPYGSRDEKCFISKISWNQLVKQLHNVT